MMVTEAFSQTFLVVLGKVLTIRVVVGSGLGQEGFGSQEETIIHFIQGFNQNPSYINTVKCYKQDNLTHVLLCIDGRLKKVLAPPMKCVADSVKSWILGQTGSSGD